MDEPEKLKQANDKLIATWAQWESDNWTSHFIPGVDFIEERDSGCLLNTEEKCRAKIDQMHRTALIALARVREAQAAAEASRQNNLQIRGE